MSGSRRFSVIRDATIEQILADTIGFRDLSWLERGGALTLRSVKSQPFAGKASHSG